MHLSHNRVVYTTKCCWSSNPFTVFETTVNSLIRKILGHFQFGHFAAFERTTLTKHTKLLLKLVIFSL